MNDSDVAKNPVGRLRSDRTRRDDSTLVRLARLTLLCL
jgi:hypothetical protein